MKLTDIRISTQLRLGFAMLLALLAGLGVLSHMQTGRLWENARKMYEHPLVVRRAVGDLNAAVLTMRIEFRDFALAENEQDRQAALANRAATEADALRRFDILRERYRGPAADIDAARRAFARWTALQQDTQGLVRVGKTVEAMDRAEKSGNVGRAREQLLEQIRTISEFSQRQADQLFDDTRKAKEAQFGQTLFLSLIALALASGQMERITDIPGDARLTIKVVGGEIRLSDIVTIPLAIGETTPAIVSLTSIHKFGENAIRLLMEIKSTLNARIHGVLAHWHLQTFAERLEAQNMQLEEQKKTIAAQAASLAQANAVLEALNRELEMQKTQLEEVSRLKSAFLSNMSHELRTPLNSVLALSQALAMQAGERLSPEERNYLEIIERNGRNLLTLINDLLDLAKIEAGRMDVHPAPFSLGQTLENLTASLAPLAGEKNIALQLDAPAELPPLESDEIRVNQILQNLMANAVKFTDQGGVTVLAESDGQSISVRMADTGIGIALEDLPHIFEEFRQVDGSTSRRHEGTGLGLAIARKAARLLGGDITVESTPGRGSVFTLTLPVKWPGEAPDAAADQVKVRAMVGKIET